MPATPSFYLDRLEPRRLLAFDPALPRAAYVPISADLAADLGELSLAEPAENLWQEAFARDYAALRSDRAPADQWLVHLDGQDATALQAVSVQETDVQGLVIATFAEGRLPSAVEANFEAYALREKASIDRRLYPLNDPLLSQQWYFDNTGSSGGVVGADINLQNVWQSYRGNGVVIGIVDDGLQTNHPDLAPNYSAPLSYDYADGDTNPNHVATSEGHGTSVAGLAGARGDNGVGISGAAPNATLAALRLLTSIDDAKEAGALSHLRNNIHIYSNSWGPLDDGERLEGPGPLAAAALQQGAQLGRGGLGSIFVWAAGNGGLDDNVNYDGYASSRYTIAVGTYDNTGRAPAYSEPGASLLVTSPSSGGTRVPITTDRTGTPGYGSGDYANFGGTSAAPPVVSGVVGLMLQANPNLGWRDVQQILARTARKIDAAHADWRTNGAGLNVNHRYGYGSIDAAAAVERALNWTNLPAEVSRTTGALPGGAIPDNDVVGMARSVNVADDLVLESVEVKLNLAHTYRGDLEITLVSPGGTESRLADPRPDDGDDYNWTFTTNRLIGERSAGTWTIRVRDLYGNDVGTLNNWQLTMHGTTAAPGPIVTADASEYLTRQAVSFTFDTDVAASLSTTDLVLRRDGAILDAPRTLAWNAATRTATFVFTTLLPKGEYTATLPAGSVSNGGTPMAAAASTFFYVLPGDANRDRAVDVADLGTVASNFRSTGRNYSQGDFNYDGVVDVADLGIIASNFRATLPLASTLAGTGASLFSSRPITTAITRSVLEKTPRTILHTTPRDVLL